MKHLNRFAIIALGAAAVWPLVASADEQLFGFVRGAETLPKGRSELYEFVTLRTGKAEGSYYGLDLETEIEHGFTDKFQASLSLDQHYFNNYGVNGDRDALDDKNAYRFGGVTGSAKYRLLSPFKDPIGLAIRLETGYLWNDEVDGLTQHEFYLAPEVDLQKNFRDDTIIWDLDLGVEWAWGKQPAEQYPASSRSRPPPASPTGLCQTGSLALKPTSAPNTQCSTSTTSSTSSFTPVAVSTTAPSVGGSPSPGPRKPGATGWTSPPTAGPTPRKPPRRSA
jgi:hypothetical protein